MTGPLPVTLPPLPGEVLSSWISRHADFYGVTPLTMLSHCLREAASLRGVDLALSKAQADRIAEMFAVSPKVIRSLSFAQAPSAAHRFIAKTPVQQCACCSQTDIGSPPILRSDLQGWRITSPFCGEAYRDKTSRDCTPAFKSYATAARCGETLMNDHAERGAETWFPPLEIARLLLMRRIPWPPPRDGDLWRYRLLGAIVPDLDAVLATQTPFLFSPKHPILPLHIRPALLAGVAIIDRTGPAILTMLQRHMIGENRTRFAMATDHLISPTFEWEPPQQMQLI